MYETPIMKSALKIRLRLTPEQQQKLAVNFGCARWVWNEALTFSQAHYEQTGKTLSALDLKKRLLALKQQYPWLKDAYSQTLQQSILNFGTARERFFEKLAHFPKLKRKQNHQSIQFPQNVKLSDDGKTLFLPKIGWVACVLHCPLDAGFKTVTVSKTPTGEYYASLCLEDQPVPEAVQVIETIEAVDLGIYHSCVDSLGNKHTNPKAEKRHRTNLRRKKKHFSRKQKGSKNREKARIQVAKVYQKAARTRQDFQHKITYQLACENQAVVVEKLHLKGMLKNHCLARALSDAALGSFVEKLKYKLERLGGHLVVVDRYFPSSKLCSACDHKLDTLSLSVRHWQCPACRAEHDRDINAAMNLKKEGIRLLTAAGFTVAACGGLCKTPIGAAAVEAGSLRL
jgi:putative transposase